MQSLMILGRQPALGLAELESLYGADKVRPAGSQAALLDVDPCLVAFDRLGGSVKFCKVLTALQTSSWDDVERFLVKAAPSHTATMIAGKMQLGLSAYDLRLTPQRLTATGLTLKKAIKKSGRSVRLTPNKELELNSASVTHNHLTGPTGWELVFVRDGSSIIIAQTVRVQDIDSYARRDRGRPKRDARVGMLPPKLAQIIINLAASKLPEDTLSSICEIPANEAIPRPQLGQALLDPFCGTGVVLQEALLMGYDVYGTDLEKRMIDYSQTNLDWLASAYRLEAGNSKLEPADATLHRWQQPFDVVASETYLGRPFTAPPSNELLSQTVSECNLIIKKFLRTIHGQLKPGARLCLAIPAWHIKPGQFKQLPLIDSLESMGYNRISFEHAREQDLIYYRENQFVARELLVITRK